MPGLGSLSEREQNFLRHGSRHHKCFSYLWILLELQGNGSRACVERPGGEKAQPANVLVIKTELLSSIPGAHRVE